MGRKGWLNVTIMITINFLTPAGDLKSNDVDFTDSPDLPLLEDTGLLTVNILTLQFVVTSPSP